MESGQMTLELFESYRNDRRELLGFLLSEHADRVVLPPGVEALDALDLDRVNAQYVLRCVRSGIPLELSAGAGICALNAAASKDGTPASCTSSISSESPKVEPAKAAHVTANGVSANKPFPGEVSCELSLSLPPFQTGLSEDDIRETAYEVLLASVGAAGGLVSLTKEERLPRRTYQPSKCSGLSNLMDIMRKQMRITPESDKRTREALLHASAGRLGKRIDGLLLPLELLCSVPKGNDKAYYLWQKRQINLIREGVLHNPYWNLDYSDHLAAELRVSLSAIQESEVMPSSKVLAHHAESLQRVRDVCLAIFERTGKPEEICHWADAYCFNVRMYEKLLSCIVDDVKANRFIEEVEEVLEVLKSTWRVMGITQTVHDTCYTWILFKQFLSTDEFSLLQLAARQMKKVVTDRHRSAAERAYLKGLRSAVQDSDGLSYLQSVLKPIKCWADERLKDYHLHFTHDRTRMETLLLLAMTAGRLLADEEAGLYRATSDIAAASKQAEEYVISSIRTAYARIAENIGSEKSGSNRLVALGEAVKELAKQDAILFSPLFSRWLPTSAALTATVVHTCYYRELKPFLENISLYTDDEVMVILPAADSLEQYLLSIISSTSEDDDKLSEYKRQMIPFEVEDISGSRGMQCVTSKLADLSDHVERAVSTESWEAISAQDAHGRSAVDIFQHFEKLMTDFFSMELPFKVSHLKTLTDGLDNAVKLYANKMLLQLGEKEDLIPPTPALSRQKKETSLKAFSKKKVTDPRLPDEKRSTELNLLTTAKLCVRLNTLHFVSNQLDVLEDSIRQQWSVRRPHYAVAARKRTPNSKQSDEVFPGFDVSRKAVSWAIEQTCVFTGLKIIFWDMRETYVDKLYKGGVTQFRMEKVVNNLDMVLGQLCEFLSGPLRDQVVFKLLEASLEGFLWVLLDGGPFRSFSQPDANLLEQDLNVLKEFFIADGDGLPRYMVDNVATQVHNVLNLYRLEAHIVVDNYRRASEQVSSKAESEIILRVLCHRKDKDSAKFLKQCKLLK